MSIIGIKELKEQAEDLVTQVEETGESIEIVVHGRVAARLVPSRPVDEVEPLSDVERAQTELALARMKELGAEISTYSPAEGVTEDTAERDARDREALKRLKELGEEISARWPKGVSAVDAIRDVRRDL
jgi:prevent-host-death family protein